LPPVLLARLPELPVLLRALPADAKLLLVRASLGRRGCLRRPGRERLPDEEPANPRRFPRTEAGRCCERA
jgi:hypothetical protein